MCTLTPTQVSYLGTPGLKADQLLKEAQMVRVPLVRPGSCLFTSHKVKYSSAFSYERHVTEHGTTLGLGSKLGRTTQTRGHLPAAWAVRELVLTFDSFPLPTYFQNLELKWTADAMNFISINLNPKSREITLVVKDQSRYLLECQDFPNQMGIVLYVLEPKRQQQEKELKEEEKVNAFQRACHVYQAYEQVSTVLTESLQKGKMEMGERVSQSWNQMSEENKQENPLPVLSK